MLITHENKMEFTVTTYFFEFKHTYNHDKK